MDISGYVGAAVRALRERRGFSQEELAHRADLDRTYVSGIERNRRNPSLQSMQRIVVALDVGLDVLFVHARKLAEQDLATRVRTPSSPRRTK